VKSIKTIIADQAIQAKKLLWRIETLQIFALIAVVLVVFLFLAKIPANSAMQEVSTSSSASSLKEIYNNPINAPHKIASYVAIKISPSIVMLRAVSFVFFALTVTALFCTLRYWHTKRAAILTTLAFATNSVVLAVSRLGTPLVLLFSWFIITAMLLWQVNGKSNKLVPTLTLIGLSALLYTPGALWFFIIMGIVYFNRFKKLFLDVKLSAVITGGVVALIIIAPLVLSFVRDTATIKEWLLIPQQFNWNESVRSVLRVPSAFIYRMPTAPLINVARLPIFDLTSGMLFLVGLNAYRKKMTLDRTRLMIGSVLLGLILGALGQTITAVIILLPFAFSVIAAGIEFLLDEWSSVFPRNTFAKGFGSLLITIAVLFGTYYQLTRFFVAWPQTPETKTVYSKSRVIPTNYYDPQALDRE